MSLENNCLFGGSQDLGFLRGRQCPFVIVDLQAVSTERAAMVGVRYKIGTAGRALALDKEGTVRFPFFRVSGPLKGKGPFVLSGIRPFPGRKIGFTELDTNSYCGVFFRVYDTF